MSSGDIIVLNRLNDRTVDTAKKIAAVSMLFDHIGLLLFPDIYSLRIIGRFALPLFIYAAAMGYSRLTSNRSLYIVRLTVFALAVHPIFMTAINDGRFVPLNTVFTIAIGIAAANGTLSVLHDRSAWRSPMGPFMIALCLNFAPFVDYEWLGFLAVYISTMVAMKHPEYLPVAIGIAGYIVNIQSDILLAATAFLSGGIVFVIENSNPSGCVPETVPSRGSFTYNWFYIFYGIHLAVLGCLSVMCR